MHDELLAGDESDWAALVKKMRAHYTMEDERRLFDMVLGTVAGVAQTQEQEALPSSVELF